MLRPLAIALIAAIAGSTLHFSAGAPSLVPAAHADDDDFDWDDDDDDDDRPWRRAVAAPPPSPPPALFVPGEIVVGPLLPEDLTRIAAAGYAVIAETFSPALGGTMARVQVPSGTSLDAARAAIGALVPAAFVEPNHLYRPVEMPCTMDNCPAFEMIGWTVPPAHCTRTPTIGMIDTRINLDHAAFDGRTIETISVVDGAERPSGATHGTAIAALLVGDGASRTPGLLPNARLLAVEAFHGDHAGDAADVYKVVRGIDAVAGRAVRVANLSFAGPANTLLELAVSRATEGGMIVVAAAGNMGPGAPPAYPGAYDGVVAVTAVDKAGNVFRQAGQGAHIAFAAPGVRLWTAASISGGRFRSGTSYAVPFVAAAIAAAADAMPDDTRGDVVERLAAQSVDLGPPGRDPVFGWGAVRGRC